MEDAKQEVMEHEVAVETPERTSFDDQADAFLDQVETETPEDSSPETKPEETETEETEDSSAETEKTEKSEGDTDEVPKEFHKHPAWQRIMKERDEARKKMEELESSIPKDEIEKFNKVTSSPAFIKASMQAEGYTKEAIDQRLQEMGHQVETAPQDDINLIMRELKMDPNSLDENTQQYLNTYVADVAKVADIIFRDRIEKLLPQELGTIKESLSQLTQTSSADRYLNEMQNIVKEGEVLDFEKDVLPPLQQYMQENPEADQANIFQYFKDLNANMTIERLKAKGKKNTRDEKRGNLRSNDEGLVMAGKLPKKTGSFNDDADAFLDAWGQ